ncbi:hypothetical protein MHK_004663 [Candidatus Magnetomorum sp. HK-1]|nr:hypothetical protein MHK_004663 [Candidatus Magnetomorum sp. HK-1]
MKKIIEYQLGDDLVHVEVDSMPGEDTYRGDRSQGDKEKTDNRFKEAIGRIKPAAEAVLESLREMNTPDEIGLEFGIKFNAKAGAVFASVDSEATFKVNLKWTNKENQMNIKLIQE